MIEQTAAVLFAFILLGAVAVGMVLLSLALFKKAMRDTVRRFRERGATDREGAATLDELGLAPRPLTERMFLLRDYRPYALQLLMEADVVKTTEAGALYLSESALERSGMKEPAGMA